MPISTQISKRIPQVHSAPSLPPQPDPPQQAKAGAPYDVAIIGGGVIGCALARRFTLEGARVVLLEKAHDLLDGASKGNSGILHTGFDAPPGSLELACMQAGYREYLAIRERLNLPLLRAGALVLAWNDAEAAALPALMDQAQDNGVTDITALTGAQARALEPALAAHLVAGFRVAGEYLIDPWSAAHAWALQARLNGAAIFCQAELTAAHFDGAAWHLQTARGALRAGLLINAAGNYGDRVETLALGATSFHITPRKGQFVVYDKTAAALAQHILLPVPTPTTKGIVICRTAFGNLLVGPTAEDQPERDQASLVPETLAMLRARGEAMLPALAGHEVSAVYAGLRPASEAKHYRIRALAAQRYVAVGGIRSTGLTASLGTARHVFDLVAPLLGASPLADPVWPRMPMLAEDPQTGPRDWQIPGHDGILCHCEQVTRRELRALLDGPLPPGSLAGVKRRSRVTMGRCQGFYCTGELAQMLAGRLSQPMLPDDGGGGGGGGGGGTGGGGGSLQGPKP